MPWYQRSAVRANLEPVVSTLDTELNEHRAGILSRCQVAVDFGVYPQRLGNEDVDIWFVLVALVNEIAALSNDQEARTVNRVF